jgi:pectinesterase
VIEGTVDFIFGWSTAVFDRCTIICKDHGYITAPSTNEGTPFGLVFLDCKITGEAEEASFYLGRPWRPFGKSAFLRCEICDMIKPQGWHNWGKAENEKTAFFAEYKNIGFGASPEKRVAWSHQLTDEEADNYTPENILGEWVKKYSGQ